MIRASTGRPLPPLRPVPDFVALAAAFLYGVFWITRRREEVRALQAPVEGGRR